MWSGYGCFFFLGGGPGDLTRPTDFPLKIWVVEVSGHPQKFQGNQPVGEIFFSFGQIDWNFPEEKGVPSTPKLTRYVAVKAGKFDLDVVIAPHCELESGLMGWMAIFQ